MYFRILSYVQVLKVSRSCESYVGSSKGTCKTFEDICIVSSLKSTEVSTSKDTHIGNVIFLF